MLALDSPLWAELSTAYGSAAEVPQQLASLIQEYNQEQADELYELLLHQNTIYTATLAAVPYLLSIAHHSAEDHVITSIYTDGGMIAAEYEADRNPLVEGHIDRSLYADIERDYHQAIREIHRLDDKILSIVRERFMDQLDRQYMLAAFMAYHGYPAVSRLLFHHPDGEEYPAACPHCGKEWYIWPPTVSNQQTSWIVYPTDPVLIDDSKGNAIQPMLETTRLGTMLNELLNQAVRFELFELRDVISYLAGEVNCPHCQQKGSIWKGILAYCI
ncbi:hypothetical protein [Paenibacillus dauci]|uniref:hypothetical protein n=1 Tax=Paenibacillus dauci TaxID=1567106 RepID=UPI0006978B69|nr:hypothetical protein [Paenibacillus dauci]